MYGSLGSASLFHGHDYPSTQLVKLKEKMQNVYMMLVYAVWSMVVEICVSQYLGTVQSTTPSFVAALPGADYLFGKKTNLQVKSFVARYATFSTTVFPNYRYFSFLYIPFFIPCWQSPVSQWPAGAGDRASKANVLTWISCNIPIPENSTLYSQVLSSTIAAPVFFMQREDILVFATLLNIYWGFTQWRHWNWWWHCKKLQPQVLTMLAQLHTWAQWELQFPVFRCGIVVS